MTLELFNFQHLILFKLFFFPTIILLITLIEKKFGPVIGGALSGLPLVSGALLCFAVLNKSYDEYYPSILGGIRGCFRFICYDVCLQQINTFKKQWC